MPSKLSDATSLRLPVGLREKLELAAKLAGRSMNAEIRMRLEQSFETDFAGPTTERMLENEIESLRAELRGNLTRIDQEIAEIKVALQSCLKR